MECVYMYVWNVFICMYGMCLYVCMECLYMYVRKVFMCGRKCLLYVCIENVFSTRAHLSDAHTYTHTYTDKRAYAHIYHTPHVCTCVYL